MRSTARQRSWEFGIALLNYCSLVCGLAKRVHKRTKTILLRRCLADSVRPDRRINNNPPTKMAPALPICPSMSPDPFVADYQVRIQITSAAERS